MIYVPQKSSIKLAVGEPSLGRPIRRWRTQLARGIDVAIIGLL